MRTHAVQPSDTAPVRHLLQIDLLVAVQQLGDIVTDDAHEEGDEDYRQDHPEADAGV